MKFRITQRFGSFSTERRVFFIWISLMPHPEKVRENVNFHPSDMAFKSVDEAKAFIDSYEAALKPSRIKRLIRKKYN